MRRLCTALLLATGCQGTDAPSKPDRRAPLERFTDWLEEHDYFVQQGAFGFSSYTHCCEVGANCFGNNPSTPYGTYFLPEAPGQAHEDHDWFSGFGDPPEPGLSRSFHLRGDEAILFVGSTPPPSKYFSFRSYVGSRTDIRTDQTVLVLGSLGPSLNHQSLSRDHGTEEVYDKTLRILTTLDAAIERDLEAGLKTSGLSADFEVSDRVSPHLVRAGLQPEADTFFTLTRVAIPEDPAAWEAYRDDPGATVLRITPRTPRALLEPHLAPDLPPRGSGTNEDAWADALDRLQEAITQHWSDHTATEIDVNPYWFETYSCIDNITCAGEIRDRFTAVASPFTLPSDAPFAVVYGVNHERTGKATYSSFSLQTYEGQIGIESVDSTMMPGSAAFYLPDEPLVDDLYAWTLSRDCASRTEPCLEVPESCPGIPLEDAIKITVRAYLEPETGTAPMPHEMLGDRLLRFE